MPTLTFKIRNKNNRGLVFNGREILTLYFYGIGIDNKQGTSIDPNAIETNVRMAQEELEKYLTIRLQKQLIKEISDYQRDEFVGTGYVRTNYVVNEPIAIDGYIGSQKQLSYPKEWFTTITDNGLGIARQISIVPNSNVNTVTINSALYAGAVLPQLGLVNTRSIGGYWHKKYITGFGCDQMPYDLLDIVGKWASIRTFNLLGDIVIGAGIASQSLSLDGLSQSIATTSSATAGAYSARIIQYSKEIKDTLKRLEGVYRGINLTSI